MVRCSFQGIHLLNTVNDVLTLLCQRCPGTAPTQGGQSRYVGEIPARLVQVLTSLDRDVRDRLGIESSPAASLSSRPELVEGPAAPESPRGKSLDPSRTKAR